MKRDTTLRSGAAGFTPAGDGQPKPGGHRQAGRRRLAAVAGALVAMLMLTGLLGAAGAVARPAAGDATSPATADRMRLAEAPLLYWGAVIGPQFTGTQAPYDMNAVKDFVKDDAGGKAPSIIPMYQAFDDCASSPCAPYAFPTVEFDNIRSYGSIPMVSWGSQSIQSGDHDDVIDRNFTLRELTSGRYDAYITAWAKAAKAFGHPFFLRFDWEMNGDWFVWGNSTNTNTAAEYVAAWRHVHDIFTRVGATNANWVWCPNNGNAEGSVANLASFYPGKSYVNWTCTDVYNFGAAGGGLWHNWNQLALPTYQAISAIAPTKPMMIAEFNSDSVGGSQASWLSTALATIPTYPRIRAAVLFDTDSEWQLEGHPAAQAAFAHGIRSGLYARNTFGDISGKILPL